MGASERNDSPTVTVVLRMGPWDIGRAVVLAVDIPTARQVMAPIDFASSDADAMTAALFCTPRANEKLASRKEVADVISREVARALVDMMGLKDTEMGYPIERKTHEPR